MLISEAKWINDVIQSLSCTKETIVLNFGSQKIKYNKQNKPLLDYVIIPITQKYSLKNLDIQKGDGIDYSGNILDDEFFGYLKTFMFDVVLLCNVLEHVTKPNEIALRLSQLVRPGGYIIFSGPYKFPIHYDPIDNGFRPKIEEVKALFAGFRVIKGEIITDFNYSYYLRTNPRQLILTLLRLLVPFYKFEKWRKVVLPNFLWWNKNFQVTCVLLQKENN